MIRARINSVTAARSVLAFHLFGTAPKRAPVYKHSVRTIAVNSKLHVGLIHTHTHAECVLIAKLAGITGPNAQVAHTFFFFFHKGSCTFENGLRKAPAASCREISCE